MFKIFQPLSDAVEQIVRKSIGSGIEVHRVLGPGFGNSSIHRHLEVVLVEMKSVSRLKSIHRRQVVSYLRSTELRVGLLMNFNTTMLKNGLQRIVR